MEYTDYVLLSIISISMLVGLLRGFVKEVFALAVWVAAFLIAFQFSGSTADLLTDHVSLPSARTAIAFGGLFLVVLVIGGLLTFLIGKLVEKTGLSGTDRLMGGLFGTVRGVLLVVVLIIVAGFTPVTQDRWWNTSIFIQSLLPLVDWASGFLPETVRDFLDLYGNGVEPFTIET